MSKIKVLIIDDSALFEKMLREVFDSTDDIDVVGVASDPLIARDKIKQLNPDVITLDVEMPRMDGLQFLSNLMRLRPMPVVMVSTLPKKGRQRRLKPWKWARLITSVSPKHKAQTSFTNLQKHYAIKSGLLRRRVSLPLKRQEARKRHES